MRGVARHKAAGQVVFFCTKDEKMISNEIVEFVAGRNFPETNVSIYINHRSA